MCRKCAVITSTTRHRTFDGLIKKIFHNQRMTTKKMGRPRPTYTKTQLLDWAITQGYLSMWQTWVTGAYDKWLSPSVDRKDNTQSYSLTNIQLVTWRQNLDNQKVQNTEGVYLHTGSKAVDQLSMEGELITSYPSAAIAGRAMVGHNKNTSNITAVCHGKWPSAYGYRWRFS